MRLAILTFRLVRVNIARSRNEISFETAYSEFPFDGDINRICSGELCAENIPDETDNTNLS